MRIINGMNTLFSACGGVRAPWLPDGDFSSDIDHSYDPARSAEFSHGGNLMTTRNALRTLCSQRVDVQLPVVREMCAQPG
jgi:hypothetical protein